MNENIAHSGAWALAVIMIVVVTWFLYRYLAPKTWHEWANAGLVQAFIIALYAEMYGFPLTIYLLVRFFGLDSPDLNANLWSTLLGMGELGMLISMLLGYALLFIGIGIFTDKKFRESAKITKQSLMSPSKVDVDIRFETKERVETITVRGRRGIRSFRFDFDQVQADAKKLPKNADAFKPFMDTIKNILDAVVDLR